MEPNSDSNRRSNMERAISNQMTRLELSEFLSDPRSRKEFFELMKLKSKIGHLEMNLNFRFDEGKSRVLYIRNSLLAAACVLLLSALAFYFRFFSSEQNEFEITKSVTTGQCNVSMNKENIILKSGKDSYCDYTISGELGLTLRILPESIFSASKKGDEVNLSLSSGKVLFTTNKKKISLKVRSKVDTLSSELLGTTLVLIADQSSKKYQIMVLEGAIRVDSTNSKVDILPGYSVLKDGSSESSIQSVGQIIKIEPKEFTRYQALSENSKKVLNENFTRHDQETDSLIKSKTEENSHPIYRITLKNKQVFSGTIEETEKFYLLKDKEGNIKEIEKEEIIELELIQPNN
ncbi:FecR domain-containing protein [Leptospira noguchii]|uniref:LIMLP_03685 family anti-sigma factor n=1 Tax=Leptospira noguchii TaxID=28182 RepID=UPI0002BD2C96|nr:FecR domain-containing protein [Leptospira noguchii]EMI71608.1 sigma factor regulatory protein, FecR/PupR family [Leptospira noguchii str. Bonito]EMS85741.1 sigma factor regulatory protein, FecR/PupR family [Leptospira noguchii str. Cascata]UOG37137.1 FecR domain-containing protein [Leptospira noguchii]